MKAKPLPSQEYLLRRLRYDPASGTLFWRQRPLSDYDEAPAGRRFPMWAAWTARCAEQPALNCLLNNGYLSGSLDGQPLLAHRVIWKMVTGEEPVEVDHRNGKRNANRFFNLRSTDHSGNGQNRLPRRGSRSGVVGVYWYNRTEKWVAGISVGGKKISLGSFCSLEDAVQARRGAEIEHGFLSHTRRKAS